jgi:NADPH:quinone reductase-like Zn-dependent oxidoreductase
VLILGGACLVGMYATQMAKGVGAHVCVTASSNAMPDGTTKVGRCTLN